MFRIRHPGRHGLHVRIRYCRQLDGAPDVRSVHGFWLSQRDYQVRVRSLRGSTMGRYARRCVRRCARRCARRRTGRSGIGIGVARLDVAATVPFDMQGDTEIRFRVSIRLTGTLDGSTFRGTGIQDRRRRSISGDKDGWIDSTKRITAVDGHKQCAGDGARTMHKTGVELRESGDGRREPGSEPRTGLGSQLRCHRHSGRQRRFVSVLEFDLRARWTIRLFGGQDSSRMGCGDEVQDDMLIDWYLTKVLLH